MERNLEEMSQEELTEFMNGPGTDCLLYTSDAADE